MDKVPSSEAFEKLPGYQFGNLQVGAQLNGGDIALVNGCNGGVVGDVNAHSAGYTINALDEMLDVAKSIEAQRIPLPQQFAASSVTFLPDVAKTYDPLGLTHSLLHNEEKSPHDMPILPWEIATGNSPELSAAPQGLFLNEYPGGALPSSHPMAMGQELGKRATCGGSSALTNEEKKQLRASRNREYAKQSRLRAKKKAEALEAAILKKRKENRTLKARLDGHYETIKSEAVAIRKKGSKSAKGKGEADIREAIEFAENTMEYCVWTYKKGSESAIAIKERKKV